MKWIPQLNKPFRLKKDLSIFMLDDIQTLNIWMRDEKIWCNPFGLKEENEIRTKMEEKEWMYLFEYKDEEFTANNLSHAYTRFLDESLGNHYVKYLEELGFKNIAIDAVDDIKEIEEDEYYKLIQKLDNGSFFKLKSGETKTVHIKDWHKRFIQLINDKN
jgi:hypothetical protein